MAQEGSEGQVQQNSSSTQQGSEASSESFVTPELQAKFDEVFGKSKGGDDEGGGTATQAPPKKKLSLDAHRRATQQQQRKAQQRREFLDNGSEDDHDEDDGAGNSDESADNRSQPLKRGDAARQAPKNGTPQQSRAQQQSDSEDEEGQTGADDGAQTGDDDGDDQPTLSPVLRHAAKRAGWTVEEADAFYADNPEKAEAYFQKMHDSFNAVSAQFAQLGNGQQQQTGQPPAQQQRQQQPPQRQQQQQQAAATGDPVEDLIAAMYGNSAESLQKDYTPEFVEEFARKPARYLQEHVIGPLKQMQAFYQQQQNRLVAQETQQFTKGLESDFGDLYGTAKKRSEEQTQALSELYQTADFIRDGARSRGVQMSVSEALDRAHAMVASKFLETQTRQRLAAQVKKRSSQMTTRPTQRKAGVNGDGKPQKSIAAATEALTRRMAELGIE